ncbi:hypothetical protein Bbelb_355000 [Branchiostoma belcheri]|nr:hypothetical protein Bbelb_355000 [Branchiostoma belcheri]
MRGTRCGHTERKTSSKPDAQVSEYLGRCLEHIERNFSHSGIVILGDTNSYKSPSLCSKFAKSLKQVVTQATRGVNQLDSIYTNNIKHLYPSPVHLPPLSTSDHQSILLPGGPWPYKRSKYIMRRQCNPEAMRRLGLYESAESSGKVAVLTSMLEGILDKSVPVKRVKITTTDKPWMSVKIKELLEERQQAFRDGNTTLYSKLKNAVANMIKKAKRRYYQREVAHLKQSNPGQWFKTIKTLMGMETVTELQPQCPTSQVTRTVPTLSDVGHKLSEHEITPFSIGQVKSRLRQLNGRKAAGPDLIPS